MTNYNRVNKLGTTCLISTCTRITMYFNFDNPTLTKLSAGRKVTLLECYGLHVTVRILFYLAYIQWISVAPIQFTKRRLKSIYTTLAFRFKIQDSNRFISNVNTSMCSLLHDIIFYIN